MPRKVKSERKALVKSVDTLHSLFIRRRDSNRCVVCGSRENTQCGHIFSRVAYSTRWDLNKKGNAHCQCSGCNCSHEYDPYPFYNWYINKFGKAEFDRLYVRYKTTRKFTNTQLRELKSVLISALQQEDDEVERELLK